MENGFTNIKILEAENRIGGRVHTIKFADNVIDMGAHMYVIAIILDLITSFNFELNVLRV